MYTVDNIVGETHATDMLTTFEVQVDATQNSQSQLVVYVSQGTVIRNVDVQYEHCSVNSKFIITQSIGLPANDWQKSSKLSTVWLQIGPTLSTLHMSLQAQ